MAKTMSKTDMLIGINAIQQQAGRPLNMSDLPPHMKEALSKTFGSVERALELSRMEISNHQLEAWKLEFAHEMERYVEWNVARAIGMPDHLAMKEIGAVSKIDPRNMPVADGDLGEIQRMIRTQGLGRKRTGQ